MAFGGDFAVFVKDGGAAERNVVIHGNVVADFGGFADDDAHAVVNEKTFADSCTGMDFNAGQKAGNLRNDARRQAEIFAPQPVGKSDK